MSDQVSRFVSTGGLVLGSALGMAGTFTSSAHVRDLLWGLDGVALIIAAVFLAIHYLREGCDILAAGFMIFVVGQTLILSCAAMDLVIGAPVFGAGASLWAASLLILSMPHIVPLWLRIIGGIAGLLFSIVALQIFTGQMITPLSKPLPFFAYPVFVAALLGWAWERFRNAP